MASVEIEAPDTGWVASVGFDEQGAVRVLDARDEWSGDLTRLIAKMLQEPAPSGRIPGAHVDPTTDDVLYDLAEALRRRKPVCRGERLNGYVSGGSRYIEGSDYAEE